MKLAYLPARFRFHNSRGKNVVRGGIFFNIAAFLIITLVVILMSWGINQMLAPIEVLDAEPIELDPFNLFAYSMRTSMRMFIAMIFSIIFALLYGALSAKNHRAEQILIPLLDILQSVPILGYISFTVTGFLLLFPGSIFGAECAAIFAIFTSQVWNLAFSFYQSLKTIPNDMIDTGIIFKLSPWQKFWRIEVPFAIPGLVTNIMVSMSSGWFFVVAAEVINVGNNSIKLPGIGSYIFLALADKNVTAIIYAISAMALVIIIYDQLILRTLVAWGDKFHYEDSPNNNPPSSWVLNLFRKSFFVSKIIKKLNYISNFILYTPIFNKTSSSAAGTNKLKNKKNDYIWYLSVAIFSIISSYYLFKFLHYDLGWIEVIKVFKLVFITMVKVSILVFIVSLIWLPIGIIIGTNHKLASVVEPATQFLAAFPANLLFPIAVILITRYNANPDIWLSFLMIIGSQWYILFNVIIGSSALPSDLKEVSQNLNIKGKVWWKKIMIPAVTPYFVTGAITTTGGAWNACIVAEVVSWGDKKIIAQGIGSYIAEMTMQADFQRIVLGIGAMALVIALINRFFWQPIYDHTSEKYRL